jgi:hypothetical protein
MVLIAFPTRRARKQHIAKSNERSERRLILLLEVISTSLRLPKEILSQLLNSLSLPFDLQSCVSSSLLNTIYIAGVAPRALCMRVGSVVRF